MPIKLEIQTLEGFDRAKSLWYTRGNLNGRPNMATKIDPSELASFKEFMLANAIQLDAITQVLIDHTL